MLYKNRYATIDSFLIDEPQTPFVCTQLRILDLCATSISDSFLSKISTYCVSNLEYLNLKSQKNNYIIYLILVNLLGGPNWNQAVLIKLFQSVPKLKYLILSEYDEGKQNIITFFNY